jgi:hypothetical protein
MHRLGAAILFGTAPYRCIDTTISCVTNVVSFTELRYP